jgi:AraC-like DNA-binding protein
VQKLQKEGWITQNEVVTSALAGTPKAMTPRTLQRHFIKTTGVTYNYLQQIYRANEAAALIKGGKSLPEVALEAGYADQSHMTRWLKHIIGSSPGDIARQDKKPGV